MEFKHERVTPLWSQRNGEAERFMRTVMKGVRIAHAQEKNWRHQLNSFMRDYRATPHSPIGKPPSEILFNRPIKTRLPQMETEGRFNLDEDKELRDKDQQKKSKMKQYADARNNARSRNLTIGDSVFVKQPKINKFSSYYDSSSKSLLSVAR